MATLDNLEIKITAASDDASKAIDVLVKHLDKLNGALNNFRAESNYMKGLNNLVSGLRELRIHMSGLDPDKIKNVAKAMDKLADSSERLASFDGLSMLTKNMEKSGSKFTSVAEKARKEAERIAKDMRFDKKDDGVDKLAKEVEHLYSVVGDDDEVRRSMENIDSLIERYARYENRLRETAKAQVDAVRSTHGKLNSDWQEALGGDYETARRNRGKLGIGNTSKSGGSAGSIIGENTSITGIHEAENETENLALALEIVEQNAELAKAEFVGFKDALQEVTGGVEGLRSVADGLVQALGLDAEKLREVSSAAQAADDSYDDFMNVDLPDDDMYMFGQRAQEAAPAIQNVAQAEEQVAQANQDVEQTGNPFQALLDGLRQLQDIHPSDALQNLEYIKKTIEKIGGESGKTAAESLPMIADGLRSFDGLTLPVLDNIVPFTQGLRGLGSQGIRHAAEALPFVAQGLRSLSGIKIDADVERISQLAYALSRFGLANIRKAVDNMPALAASVKELVSSLSGLPQVSDSTIRLVEAMGNLNIRSNNASEGTKRLGLNLKNLTGHMKNAHKATKSLASAIGKVYATYWLLFRVIGKIGKAINIASDLKEVQNVVDVTFGDMADKMNDFAQGAVDALGMSELTAKEIGSKFQAMGANMGITKDMVKNTNDFVQTATSGYADVADSMADVSINLTRLVGDMASFYNQDFADVAEKMQSVFTGTTKPLRTFGLDLGIASLQAFALANGINADVKSMTQAEKTLLRYQYVMAHTTAAQGDFQRTIGTWANQVRIAKERLKQLGIILGQIGIYTFKPLVVGFNNAMKTIIKGATGLLNSLGKIFGWQVEWEDGGILQDEEEAAGDLADDMGDAADNAKKFKNFLLGIDELNLLQEDKSKDKDKGSGLGQLGGLGDATGGLNLRKTKGEFDSLYDTLYKLGRRISELLKDFLKNIDWDAVYKKARRFGKGLAQFFNGLLADAETFYQIGKALAGGINAFANVVDAFHKEFDGWQLGVDIGNLVNGFTENLDWSVIKSAAVGAAHDLAQTINAAFVTVNWKLLGKTIAEGLNTAIDYFYTLGTEIKWSVIGTSIADAINGLFENFDFAKAAQTLSAWIKGILDTLIKLLDKTNWKKIGDSIGTFISNIDFVGIASRFAELFWKAMNAAVSTWVGLFEGAPIATAIATVIATGLSSRGVRRGIGKAIGNLSDYIGSSLSRDLGNLFNGTLLKKFKGGYISSMTESIATSKLFGSKLRGISAGFNEISNSLSGVTKALGSTVVGFAEFFTVKDAIYDIVSGTDDMGKAFIELGAAVGVAGVALSALLGVPAGLLITGVTAGIAALVGLVDALDDIRETNAIAALTKDMGDAYYTMGDLVLKFKDVSEAVTGGLDKLHGNYEKVENLKTELSGIASGYDLIVSAVESGNTITGKSMDELIGNIGEVKSAWEEYINAQYSYLIQSTMNDYQFAKSQGILTEQMEKEYLDRINALTSGRDQELSEMETLMEELSKAQRYYDEMVAQGKTGSALSFAEKQLAEATKAVLEFGSATGAVASGGVSEFENSIESLKNVKIDFSDFDSSNYDEMLTEAVGYFNQIQEAYQNSKDIIEQTVQDRMKADPTLSEEEARASVQMYFDALNSATQDSLDSLQLSIYDIWTASFNAGDEVTLAGDMKANFIIPFMEQMTGLYEEAANGEKPKLASVTNSLFRDLWDNGDKGFNTMKIGDDWKNYADEYRKQLEPMSDETKRATSESGQAFKELEQQTSGSVSVIADGIESLSVVSAAFTKTNKDFRRSVQDGSGDVVSQYRNVSNAASDVAKGVGDISNAASKYDEVRRKVKVTADEFNASSEKVKALKGHVDELDGSVTTIDTDFSTMLTNLSTINTTLMEDLPVTTEAFTTFFSGIQTDAENVLNWFTETFEKHFTSQYWETALAGVGIGFHNAFNTAIEAVKGIWTLFATWAKENMKIKIPKTKLPNGKETEEIDLSVKVGSFYNGGFPEDGFFFANHSEMVGQFSNGKTAVANNDQIVEGIKQGVYEAVSAAWSSQSGGGNVTVEITGDASDIFRAVVRENDRSIMRTGASPIRV